MNSASGSQLSMDSVELVSELKSELLSLTTDALSRLDTWERQLDYLIAKASDALLAPLVDAPELYMLKRTLLGLQHDTDQAQTEVRFILRIARALTVPSSSSTQESTESSTQNPTASVTGSIFSDKLASGFYIGRDPKAKIGK